ncbi:superoxide dismutase family protein [Streptomyces sp. NPDC053542]|uniref:superoxide dismutase family protein n=1 Tax=Streptomyces sp. NPDC053542 TaxID=3365710 RepID=UPI0037D3D246
MAAGMVTGAMAALLLAAPAVAAPAHGGTPGGGDLVVGKESRFTPVSEFDPSDAVTYDTKKVPTTARIAVAQWKNDHGMTIRLKVKGLQPHRTYGSHVHTKPCGEKPDSSGPHYQNRKDPKQPSVDPKYANPENEVWLDFTTDSDGDASVSSKHWWWFRQGEARSVVIHDHKTHTGHGHAGMAGDRLGCLSVPFKHTAK